jgi:hypothetical protein
MPGMNENQQKLILISAISAICCAILLCISALVAAFKLGAGLQVWWVVFGFQIFLTLIAAAVSIAISIGLVGWSLSVIGKQIGELSRHQQDVVEKLQKRTPTFVVAAALVTQLVMVFADKAFKDDLTAITVTILLILLFWSGNEFMLRESKWARFLGWTFWLAAVVSVPVAIMLDRHIGLNGLWMAFRGIEFHTQLVLILGTIVAVAAPFVVKQ